MIERIGFIGLGLMGKPMARNLMKAGYQLTVHNRSRTVVDVLAAEGATPAYSPQEAAEAADLVITILFTAPANTDDPGLILCLINCIYCCYRLAQRVLCCFVEFVFDII